MRRPSRCTAPTPPPARHRPCRRWAWWRDEAGVAAVELALVAPILLVLVLGIFQFGALFYLHNNMVTTANDVTRRLAIGKVTEAEAQAMAAERLAGWGTTFAVAISEPSADDVLLEISVPIADVVVVEVPGLALKGNLKAEAQMRKEYW